MTSRVTPSHDRGDPPTAPARQSLKNYATNQQQLQSQQVLPQSSDSKLREQVGDKQQHQSSSSGKQSGREDSYTGGVDDTMELEDDNFSAATTLAVRASSSRYFSTRKLQDRDVGSVTGSSFVLPRLLLNKSNDTDSCPQRLQQRLQQQQQQQQPQDKKMQCQSEQNRLPTLMGPPSNGSSQQDDEEEMLLEDDDDISTLTEYSMAEDEEDNNSQTTSQTSLSQTTSVVTTATDSTTVPTSHIFPGNGGPVQGQYPRDHLLNMTTKRNMAHDNQLSNSQFKRRKRS